MDSPDDELEAIRQHIRNICINDQVHWEASWKSLLDNPETARRGFVLPDRFVETLEENSVFFPRKTARALVAQFQAPSGAVQVAKFLKWIELSRPADYVDPELVFARLPQPYRRIVKVLECDILDVAWELIKEQSARFKAETAAALAATARSNHSLGIATSELVNDDYDNAKKRYCKTFAAKNYDEARRVAVIAQHETLPVVLVALEDQSCSSGDDSGIPTSQCNSVVLQLLHTLTHDVLAEGTLPVPLSTDAPAPSESATNTRTVYEVASVTPIRVRSATLETPVPALVVAVQLTVSTTTTVSAGDELSETTTQATSIYVFEITGVNALVSINDVGAVSSSEPLVSFELIATGTFDYAVAWLELSPDAQFLALPTALGAVAVLTLSHEEAVEQGSSSTPSPPLDCSAASTVFLTIELDANAARHEASPVRAHFLVQPSSSPDVSPAATLESREAYALVVCSDTYVRKYVLPSVRSSAAVPTVTWRHVAAITSSALDATTQYLVVGLANGAVVVWDTLEELDYAYLPPASSASVSSAATTTPEAVDSVVMYRTEYIVAFSAATQRVRFVNIRKRIAPVLVRTVTAPAPSGGHTSDSNGAIQIVGVAATASSLDMPIVVLTYSNGTHMLYDLRTAEAGGSLRTRALSSLVASPVLLSPHGVVVIAQAATLAIYDWLALLTTSYSTLAHELQEHRLAPNTLNAKRLVLAHAPLAPLSTLANVSTDAVDNLLRRAAGVPLVSASSRQQQQQLLPPSSSLTSLVSDQRQASRLGPSASSVGISPSPPSRVGTSNSSSSNSHETLELAVSLTPLQTSMPARFRQYVLDLDASVTKDKDTKTHRRRTELLKALTTGAW